MAEIEDEAGFEAMLNFVMNQWRNVRQRKGIAVSIPPEGSRTDARWTVVNGPGHSTGAFTEAQVKSEFGISSSEDDGDGGVLMKPGNTEKKKPKFKIVKNPVLILDPFFILPTNLLDACIKVLPVANTSDTAISIDNSQASSQGTNPQTNSARAFHTSLFLDTPWSTVLARPRGFRTQPYVRCAAVYAKNTPPVGLQAFSKRLRHRSERETTKSIQWMKRSELIFDNMSETTL
ncbi:hypothetical protein L917_11308 [Phytophthora nicotianae]|uniref:Uncharacterized protein n=1 Tax=Phytophthora nicotianae TaxID=4792 RepID=W2KXF2_PHYNI|nr:hypothetical protein L917_11308 [Phytophthora nicotianae]